MSQLIAPVAAFSESPAGRLPAETLNVYEPLPPVALTVCAYAAPSVPLGSVAGFTVIAALIVRCTHVRRCAETIGCSDREVAGSLQSLAFR